MFDLNTLIYVAPAIIITVTLHELAHGWVSYKFGDPTPKEDGRLSLNPLRHLDPIGTIALLVAGFGWAKPVHIDPRYYKDAKTGVVWTAFAGPMMNFIIAFIRRVRIVIITIITVVIIIIVIIIFFIIFFRFFLLFCFNWFILSTWFFLFLKIENDVIIIDDININWKFHEASVNTVTFWKEESIVLFFLSHESKKTILKAHTDFYCELFFFT